VGEALKADSEGYRALQRAAGNHEVACRFCNKSGHVRYSCPDEVMAALRGERVRRDEPDDDSSTSGEEAATRRRTSKNHRKPSKRDASKRGKEKRDGGYAGGHKAGSPGKKVWKG